MFLYKDLLEYSRALSQFRYASRLKAVPILDYLLVPHTVKEAEAARPFFVNLEDRSS
jgi:hypothetical protein